MWDWVVANLRIRKRLTETDVPALERMIYCYEFLRRAEADILENGLTVTIHAKTGSYPQTSPSVGQVKTFGDSFRRWAAEFGFTPSGRGAKATSKGKRSALDDFNAELTGK